MARDLCDFKISGIHQRGDLEVTARYHEGEIKQWSEDVTPDVPAPPARYGRQAVIATVKMNFDLGTPIEDILKALADDLVTKSLKPPISEVEAVRTP